MTKENLNRLMAERTQLRRVFTIAAKKVDELMKEGKEDEVRVKFAELADKAERLFKVDAAINEVIYDAENDEKQIETEFNITESYREHWFSITARTDLIFNGRPRVKDDDKGTIAAGSTVKLKKKYKFPKLELRKFDGTVEGWISFWSSFKKVDADETLDDAEKFDYLIQCMIKGSPAREFIDSWVPTAANYPKAVKALRQRFGRDELLIELYVRKLLRLVLNQAANKGIGLRSLYDQLETILRALKSLGVTRGKYANVLLPLAESALPAAILRIWERIRPKMDPTKQLEEMLEFLKKEVEGEERVVMARQAFARMEMKVTSHENSKPPSIAGDLVNVESQNRRSSCIIFEKSSHDSSGCFNASGTVTTAPTSSDSLVEQSLSNICLPNVLMQTLQVVMCGKTELNVRLLIDTGLQRSYVTEPVMRRLGYKPIGNEQLVHGLFGESKSKATPHRRYKIRLRSKDGKYACYFDALGTEKICLVVPVAAKGPWLQELAEKKIVLSDTNEGPIDILIGADIAGKLYTGEVTELGTGLVAIRTLLGWTLMGKVNNMVTMNYPPAGSQPSLTCTAISPKRDGVVNLPQYEQDKKAVVARMEPAETQHNLTDGDEVQISTESKAQILRTEGATKKKRRRKKQRLQQVQD